MARPGFDMESQKPIQSKHSAHGAEVSLDLGAIWNPPSFNDSPTVRIVSTLLVVLKTPSIHSTQVCNTGLQGLQYRNCHSYLATREENFSNGSIVAGMQFSTTLLVPISLQPPKIRPSPHISPAKYFIGGGARPQ